MSSSHALSSLKSCAVFPGRTGDDYRFRIKNNTAASKLCAAAPSAVQTCPLPSGQEIAFISKPDVAFLYREVFQKQAYIQHGVTLSPGNTVLDVGANIGLFAAFAAKKVEYSGRVIAVEPLPPIFDALTFNINTMLCPGTLQALGLSFSAFLVA